YAQELLPARRDLRMALDGEHVIGGNWRQHREGGFHNNAAHGGRLEHGPRPAAAVALFEGVAPPRSSGYAGRDGMESHGQFYLLEFNRLFGNQGLTEQGIEPSAFIHRYLAARAG